MLKLIQEFLNELGFNITLIIGGLIGGIIGRKKERPFTEQLIAITISVFAANYLSPVVAELFGMTDKSLAGLGFVIGYSNKHALDYIMDKVKKKVDDKIDAL